MYIYIYIYTHIYIYMYTHLGCDAGHVQDVNVELPRGRLQRLQPEVLGEPLRVITIIISIIINIYK